MSAPVISGDAESAVLRDVRMVLDELLAQCSGAGRIAERRQVSGELGLAIADRSFPDAMALVFDRGQKREVRLLVLDAIIDRVLKLPDVHAAAVEEQIKLDSENYAEERSAKGVRTSFYRVAA